jgi:two-component system NtrC family sensor kinase
MFTVYTAVCSTFQRRILEQQARAEAARHGDLLRQGLHASMLGNERERTHAFIRLIGDEPGVEAIRIYNKQGVIQFSNTTEEIGAAVDLKAEACYVCHASSEPLTAVSTMERSRIYRKPGSDYRVLGLITPIHNEESCWSAECHAHSADQSILGVLDVQLTMQAVDEAFAAARQHAFVLAVSIIFIAMLVTAGVIYRAVYLPTRKLHRGTEALAAGDLDVQIDLHRSDELGKLADSFNHMASSLKAADAELRAWSQTLEQRVSEKTAELERMHSQMMQVEKAASLGRMAATVAHELNNPLSGIVTYAKLVARRLNRLLPAGPDRQQVADNLELIRSESMRCGEIVRGLLTFAREHAAEFKPAHLHDLVDRAFKLVGHHIELGGVEAESRLELQDDSIICDPDRIVQALIALMINAVEAMPDGGILTVRTSESPEGLGRRINHIVSDTGIGIPEDVRERIFDPFFSTKDETKGVGLGLAVVYGIVQRHEGVISVDSAVGKGSSFTIDLPRDPAEAQPGKRSMLELRVSR